MRKIRRHKNKKHQKVLIIGSLALLLFLCVGYAAFQTNLSITAKGNIKEKSRVIQAWGQTSQTDFHSNFYKQNIVSATFLDNNNVPSNATESWNVSEDKENGGVMAWVVPNNEDNTKYDLYIGAKDGVIANENSSYLFNNFSGLQEINFNDNFDTINALNMSYMFADCTSLINLDLSSFDTSNVTNMSWMFYNCRQISSLNLTSFNTEKVINMSRMFNDCQNLIELLITNFNTSNVTDMNYMFAGCASIERLDLSNFNTSNVKNMGNMFDAWSTREQANIETSLKEIIFGENFNTSNVENMTGMFMHQHHLNTLNLCSFDTSSVTNMISMFRHTTSLKAIYVSPNWTTANADTTGMFENSGVSSVTTGQC